MARKIVLLVIKWARSFFWRQNDKEHRQTHYVLPSRNNHYRDRVRYFKLFSTCFGKFSGGVCGCVSSFTSPVVSLDKEIYSNLCLLNNGYRRQTAGVTLRYTSNASRGREFTTLTFCSQIFYNTLINEAEYLMKNYGDQGGITPSEISIILHMVRKPNSIIVLLFIQNNS